MESSRRRNRLQMFREGRCLNESLSITSCEHEDQDPFDELDSGQSRSATDELEDLICQVPMPNEARCSISEY